jgi:hypothetical protein
MEPKKIEKHNNPLEVFFSSGKIPSEKYLKSFFSGIFVEKELENSFILIETQEEGDRKVQLKFNKYDLNPPEYDIEIELLFKDTDTNSHIDRYTITSFNELKKIKNNLITTFLKKGTQEDKEVLSVKEIFALERGEQFPSLSQIRSLFTGALIEQEEDVKENPSIFNIRLSENKERLISLNFEDKKYIKIELLEPPRVLVRERNIKSENGFREFLKEWKIYLEEGIEKCPNMKNWDKGNLGLI